MMLAGAQRVAVLGRFQVLRRFLRLGSGRMSDGPRVYGIDLGTTSSCIAYVDEDGRPVVVPNADNQLTTASAVFFETRGSVVVGDAAREVAELYPSQVVTTVKRAMGDPHWWTTQFGEDYRPQDVSSFIIRKLVGGAEAHAGDTTRDAVLTVPAWFGPNQKAATREAGELAGLNVVDVIPEPTAAAIAYGLDAEGDQVIVIYDLGGGNFNITIVETNDGAITVLCTAGDHELGGKNWDEAIVEHLAERFEAETGVSSETLLDDLETFKGLMRTAEVAKVKLSSRRSVVCEVRHEGHSVRIEITRDEFDAITAPLLQRTISQTKELLETARGKGHDRVDKVLLVGGSTAMPQVRKALEAAFPFEVCR
jgi:molecular chaperone DnaK